MKRSLGASATIARRLGSRFLWQVEIQGDWINVRDELAAFIVLKKNGWGIQKEQVPSLHYSFHDACDARLQVWFATGNISGQFSKMPAFEGNSISSRTRSCIARQRRAIRPSTCAPADDDDEDEGDDGDDEE